MHTVSIAIALLAATAAGSAAAADGPGRGPVYSALGGVFAGTFFPDDAQSAIAARLTYDTAFGSSPGVSLTFTRAEATRAKYHEHGLFLRGGYRLALLGQGQGSALSIGLEVGVGGSWRTDPSGGFGYSLGFSGGPLLSARIKILPQVAVSAELSAPWVMTQVSYNSWTHIVQPTFLLGASFLP